MAGRLLIANRGEIAVRVIRTAHVLGWETIAVYSQVDKGALWTRLSTFAAEIGGVSPADSYLAIEKLMDAALQHGATAVHPGYGMLSENAAFAQAVRGAGMIFVGPDTDTIALMGDKVRARRVAEAVGVPVLPGSEGPVTDEQAPAAAEAIGWPVLVKASHGGGGRGMRVAENHAELSAMCKEARREAHAAFGRSELFLEAYRPAARHVEVQVLGSGDDEPLILGDRDCSLQRRRQKLVEEAPAPGLSDSLRSRLHGAACLIARSVGYRNAGTVEFLVETAGERFFFLEMNTRLQVEHGVTELVTGLDLVALQLRVATGEPLGFSQAEVVVAGHAIQSRIAAEDPVAGFLPAAGQVGRLTWPGGPGIRCDAGVAVGDVVPPYYDSMFAKIMAWAPERETARRRLALALAEVEIEGIEHTSRFAGALIDHPDFASGSFNVASVEGAWAAELVMPAAQRADDASSPGSGRMVRLPWGDREVRIVIDGGRISTSVGSSATRVADRATPVSMGTIHGGGGHMVAPMDGSVVAVNVVPGSTVAPGEVVIALESMKMELAVRALGAGRVEAVHVRAGSAVGKGALLVTIDPD